MITESYMACDPDEMPSGSVRCTFDNNQIIGRTYHIQGDKYVTLLNLMIFVLQSRAVNVRKRG